MFESGNTAIRFGADNFQWIDGASGANGENTPAAKIRDPGWYHLVFAWDSSAGVLGNRIYVNGVELDYNQTGGGNPSGNSAWNTGSQVHTIGRNAGNTGRYYDGMMSQCYFVDGQTLDPESFGFTDPLTNTWRPKKYTGTFGTNGFYLPMDNQDDFEIDKSGNGNNWTKNNFSGTFNDPDVVKDSPSGAVSGGRAQTGITTTSSAPSNYATWNPLNKASTAGLTLSDGNLSYTNSSTSANNSQIGSLRLNDGKFYFENILTAAADVPGSTSVRFGISKNSSDSASNIIIYNATGNFETLNTTDSSPPSYTAGNVIGVAVDCVNGSIEFFKDGVSVGTKTFTVGTDDWNPFIRIYKGGSNAINGSVNFGQKPFKYAPPQGYLPLNAASARPDNSYYEEHVELHVNYNTNCTYSNGNLTVVTPSGNGCARSGVGMHTGKYYAECVWDSGSSGSVIGIVRYDHLSSNNLGQGAIGYGYYSNGSFQNNGVDSGSPDSYANGDVIGIEFDATNGTLDFYKNGSSQGEAFTGLTSPPYYFAVSDGSSGGTGTFTYRFKESSFTQSIPSGAIPLHRDLDAKKTVPRPDQYVGIVTYTGTTGDGTITSENIKFTPDFVWVKYRAGTESHALYDSVRGATNRLRSDTQARQNTGSNELKSFIPGGFTTGNNGHIYFNGYDYVAWCWKAGGSESTFNVDGVGFSTYTSVPSEYNLDIPGSKKLEGCSVGRDSGFSIVKWISEGNEYDTIPHGLGRQPSFVAAKAYSGSADRDWILWTTLSDGGLGFYHFNNQDGEANSSVKSLFTSKTFGVYGSDINTSGEEIVAYVWADTPGVFKAGAYESNNSTDGPFIELGFRPALILLKNSDSNSTNWLIDDAVRNKYNGKVNTSSFATNYAALATNSTSAEPQSGAGTFEGNYIDFLSNGFKLRNNAGTSNGSSSTIIYYAWAEAPAFNLYGGQSNAR
jgi:hypothetical protein